MTLVPSATERPPVCSHRLRTSAGLEESQISGQVTFRRSAVEEHDAARTAARERLRKDLDLAIGVHEGALQAERVLVERDDLRVDQDRERALGERREVGADQERR